MNTNIKYILLTFLIILWLLPFVHAQEISGRLIDQDSKEAIPFANIALEKLPMRRVITGGTTDIDGNFKISASPNTYNLTISVLGFNSKTIPMLEIKENNKLELGTIELSPVTIEVAEVNITANRSFIENKPGKQILNVGREIAGGGGNISQILKIVPSVEVTPRGDISIRGNQNIKVLINGKEMTYGIDPAILLKQLPASTVEKIEVVTNASVREDPESSGGAINIVLKKNANDGFHYGINIEAGTTPFKGNGGFNLNYAKDKLNTYLTYGAYIDKYNFSNKGKRNITSTNSSIVNILDDGKGNYKDLGHLILGGIDYDISNKTTLNTELTYNRYKENWEYNLDNVFATKSGEKLNGIVNNKNRDQIRFLDLSTRIESKPADDQKMTVLIHVSRGKQNSKRTITERGTYFKNPSIGDIISKSNYTIGEASFDYQLKTSAKGTIEMGANSELVDYRATQDGNGSYSDSRYWDYNQQKQAVYAMYKHKFGKLTCGIGARPEYYKSKTLERKRNNKINQEYTKLYPNIIVNYQISNTNVNSNVSLSYSKRIRRPEAEEIDPIADYANPSHIYQGNPHLKPEFIHTVELSYNRLQGNNKLNVTLFGRKTDQLIQQRTELRPGGVLFTSYINHSSGKDVGLEMNGKVKPLGCWESTVGASYIHSKYASPHDQLTHYHKQGNMWQLKWNNFITCCRKYTLQVQAQYYGKTTGMFYTRNPYNVINIGVERKTLKGLGTIGISLNDALNSGGKENYKIIGPGFDSQSTWKLDSRYMKVSFNFYIN
ncbi:TonB-dependent receptor [Puteibacter caeruleilacunae]|nr:TonB-dependent receptor [Puteibacter caeruleilacunae]